MKKFLLTITLAIFLIPSIAFSAPVIWKNANQITVGWDAVTDLADGSALPSTDVIKYEILLKDAAGTVTTATLAPITETQYTITFSTEGRYLAGVKAMRYDAEGNFLSESEVAWSDNEVYAPDPFGVLWFASPGIPGNLRTVVQ